MPDASFGAVCDTVTSDAAAAADDDGLVFAISCIVSDGVPNAISCPPPETAAVATS